MFGIRDNYVHHFSTLLSRPMLKVTKNARGDANDIPSSPRPYNYDTVLVVLARMNILNSIALLTTILNRILEISSYWYCPDECWLTYINYNTITIDTFMNIFCILCSFSSAKKYYYRWCGWCIYLL